MEVFGFMPFGYEGSLVNVKTEIRQGIPSFDIVGIADSSIQEARNIVKTAIKSSGYELPNGRVLMSFLPTDLKKEGHIFDLTMAVSLLEEVHHSQTNKDTSESILVIGKLDSLGNTCSINAVHAAVSTAYSCGITKCIVPISNLNEAREIKGMKVFGASNLKDAFNSLSNPELFKSSEDVYISEEIEFPSIVEEDTNRINQFCKKYSNDIRALAIAIAGKHNLLIWGEPSCEKSLLLQQAQSLTPLLTVEESQSVTRIYSLSGLLSPNESLIRKPPFRIPHQTASIEGICGGGVSCRPGEVSLSHNGILFLDEASEFKTSVLQMLRVSLESGTITLSRAGRSTTYPARHQLFMSTSPCPCGNFGSKSYVCFCSKSSIKQYWHKFSKPLLDRMDIKVHFNNSNTESTLNIDTVKTWIKNAIKIQRGRKQYNAYLSPQGIEEYCNISDTDKELLESSIVKEYDNSQRIKSRILKLSRTIADMEMSEHIQTQHLKEAISLYNIELVNTVFED